MSTLPNAVDHTVEHASHELYSVVTEVNPVHLAFTLLAVFILVFGMISALIKEKIYAGEAIVATAFGVIFGPYCANLINPRTWGNPSFDDITLEFTRIVLALSVFAVGVELPRAYVKRHWRSLLMVLGPLMIAGWLITGALIYALVPRLSFLGALVVAACATPTDPILAASVVGKGKFAQKHVPSHIRHLLQCESGCNDGAAFPFLYLAMFLIFREDRSVGHAVGMWIVLVILYQIVLGVVIGVAVGIIARKLLKFAKRREFIDRESMIAMYVSLAIFTTAVTTLAGSDDLLAAFACGAAFAWDDWFSESIEDSNFSNILDLLINCATFIYIGATMPFEDFENPMLTLKAWRLAVLGIAVLLVRRLPVMLALYKFIPDIKTFREAIFAGFFGPMGVGAIFIATLALSKLPTPNIPPETSDDVLALTIQPITYFLVLCSIIVHGSSVPFFNLGRRVHTVTRTWTNRSESEPNWLSRVKRVGADGNVDLPRDEKNDEKAAQRRREEERDLEAGEEGDLADQAIDDPGMDTGDFSARDYATGRGIKASRHSSGGSGSGSGYGENGNKISPTTSSETTVAGSSKPSKSHAKVGNEEAAFHKNDERRERHDSGSSDEDEVWDEGDDIITDRHHGEDVEVERKGKSTKGGDKEHTERGERHQDEDGPGFPGHRFEEIEKMLGSGGGTESDDETPGDDEDVQQEEQHRFASTQPAERASEPDDLLHEASRRVAQQQIAQEKATASEGKAAPMREAETSKVHTAETRPEMSKGKTRMSAQRLASMTGLARPQPKRKASLTPEEKRARDAWCRKERKDVDDDQVKTWISGKHIVLERNNGEDVEIIDVDPSEEAREKANKSKDVNFRELPIQQVQAAKQDVANERSVATSSSTEGVGNVPRSHQQKRFDLKALRQNQSFKKLFGGDETSEAAAKAVPSASQSVPTILEDTTEDEAEARALPQASSSASTGAGMTSIMRQRSNVVNPSNDQGEDKLTSLSARRTGIPVERTETTDSQVRFGSLPKPSRR